MTGAYCDNCGFNRLSGDCTCPGSLHPASPRVRLAADVRCVVSKAELIQMIERLPDDLDVIIDSSLVSRPLARDQEYKGVMNNGITSLIPLGDGPTFDIKVQLRGRLP